MQFFLKCSIKLLLIYLGNVYMKYMNFIFKFDSHLQEISLCMKIFQNLKLSETLLVISIQNEEKSTTVYLCRYLQYHCSQLLCRVLFFQTEGTPFNICNTLNVLIMISLIFLCSKISALQFYSMVLKQQFGLMVFSTILNLQFFLASLISDE